MKRMECLDGLRGALAVYVMLGHLAPFAEVPDWIAQPLSHGGAAVDVFFMLSGLVIMQSLHGFRWQPGPFLIARVTRTYPVYLAMFSVAVAVGAIPTNFARLPWIAAGSPARDIWSAGWPHTWAFEIATHLTMTHGLVPDSAVPGAWVGFLGAAWSLSTEWQFYVLALLIGLWAKPRRLLPAFLGLAAAGLFWHAAAPDAWQFSRAFLPNKAAFFALGIASADLPQPRGMRRYAIVLLATLAACAASGRLDKLLPPLVWTLCLAAQHQPRRIGLALLARALRTRLMQWLGALSYGIYLANEPVHKLLGLALAAVVHGNGAWFTALWLPGATALPLALAAILHRWIEEPAHRWGRGWARSLQSPHDSLPGEATCHAAAATVSDSFTVRMLQAGRSKPDDCRCMTDRRY
jgi:peptidoglycan/LPS O-acetylase OafA/YrhL